MKNQDIFDKIMSAPLLSAFQPFYRKNKEILLYLFFGGLAFLVSMGTFAFFEELLKINELIANVISWIITVWFAFITNRKWVFIYEENIKQTNFWSQALKFYTGRIATLIVEEGILLIFVTKMKFNSILIKVIAQVVVIILNYLISKVWIFKKNHSLYQSKTNNNT